MHPRVLAQYPPAIADLDWHSLGAAGGFSGASVWQGRSADGPQVALKFWPAGYPPDRLAGIHRLMIAAREGAELAFVPAVVPTRAGPTVAIDDGRVWDATAWMPGTANFAADPTDERLAAAVGALAELHRSWAPPSAMFAPCPGVGRRLDILRQFRPSYPSEPLLGRAELLLPDRVSAAVRHLSEWSARPLPVQPCLCDPWHDHLLFTGNKLTGLLDYGAVKPDHPAVDLARMLGDLVGGDATRFGVGLAAYRQAGGPVEVPDDLVRLLDETGIVCAVIGWLGRLPDVTPTGAVAVRLRRLVDRLDRIGLV